MNEFIGSVNFKDFLTFIFAIATSIATLKFGIREVFIHSKNVDKKLNEHVEKNNEELKAIKQDIKLLQQQQTDFKYDISQKINDIRLSTSKTESLVNLMYDERKNNKN